MRPFGSDIPNLTGQLLLAHPNLRDPNFRRTVLFLSSHDREEGAHGLVINRPTDIDLEALFNRIDLKLEIEPLLHVPVYFGGPVQTERGFVLHDATESTYTSSMQVPGGLEMTTSKDVLTSREREVVQLLAEGKSTKEVAVALGLSVKTAETHRSNLMRKLDVHSVSQLVLYAVRNNIVQVVAPPSDHP